MRLLIVPAVAGLLWVVHDRGGAGGAHAQAIRGLWGAARDGQVLPVSSQDLPTDDVVRHPPVGPTGSPPSGPDSTRDLEAGFDILPEFERFPQRMDVFSRSFWDPTVQSPRTARFYETYRTPLQSWRAVDGYTQRDYALRNAAWHVPDIFAELKESEDRREGFLDSFSVHREGPGVRLEVEDVDALTREVKQAARVYGADLVGIAPYDPRWVYHSSYSRASDGEKPIDLPGDVTAVIVIAQAMDYDLLRTVPSALSGTATGVGYARDTVVLLSLAQFIRNLGYDAVASMNDTALAIPYAIQAGLGEYGKNGLLITPEFGPRVRLGKVFTTLPLRFDRPRSFGVRQTCQRCRACVDACPSKAIPGGEPTAERHNESNLRGVRKWSVDGVKCFTFWANQNTDCSICVRVCPYNRDYRRWYNRLWARLLRTPLRGWMLKLDRWTGRGERVTPAEWWRRVRAKG
ncbi:MAG: reductive dehalogenase domain-containing protein [Gemmatimonadota bacterium]